MHGEFHNGEQHDIENRILRLGVHLTPYFYGNTRLCLVAYSNRYNIRQQLLAKSIEYARTSSKCLGVA